MGVFFFFLLLRLIILNQSQTPIYADEILQTPSTKLYSLETTSKTSVDANELHI